MWWFPSIQWKMSQILTGLIRVTMTFPYLLFQPHQASFSPYHFIIQQAVWPVIYNHYLTLHPSVSLSRCPFSQEGLSITYNCLIKYYASFEPQLDKPLLIILLWITFIPYIYLHYDITKSIYLFINLSLLVELKPDSFCIPGTRQLG